MLFDPEGEVDEKIATLLSARPEGNRGCTDKAAVKRRKKDA
jgi:hypothetical protein